MQGSDFYLDVPGEKLMFPPGKVNKCAVEPTRCSGIAVDCIKYLTTHSNQLPQILINSSAALNFIRDAYPENGACRLNFRELQDWPGLHFVASTVTSVNFACNSFSSFDSSIAQMSHIHTIEVQHNRFRCIPTILSKLQFLISVDFSFNNIQEVNFNVFPRHVEIIRISNCGIERTLLSFLPELKELHMKVHDMTFLRLGDNFPKLIELNLNNGPLVHLELNSSISSLIRIFASGNCILFIPKSVYTCKCLELLDLTDNKLTNIEYDIGIMDSLLDFRCEGNPLSAGLYACLNMGWLHGFKELFRILYLTVNSRILNLNTVRGLKSLPTEMLDNCSEVLHMEAVEVGLQNLEGIIKRCLSLRSLNVARNSLSGMSTTGAAYKFHPTITYLNVSSCSLSGIPWNLTGSSLETLDISENKLNNIDDVKILGLRSLRDLKMRNCGLVTLGSHFGDLTQMQSLDIAKNQIVDVAKALMMMPFLSELKFSGNPSVNPPPEIARLDENAGIKYLKKLQQSLRTNVLDLSGSKLRYVPHGVHAQLFLSQLSKPKLCLCIRMINDMSRAFFIAS
jgi:Leucine-rich repeat (LRR) protein